MKLGHELAQSRSAWPRLTDELLDSLRHWGDEHGLPGLPAEQLAVFAHSCHYDRAATLRCMSVYYRMRATVPEFFARRDPTLEGLRSQMKALYYVALPKPDKQGNRVVLHGLNDTNSSSYVFDEAVKLLLMTMDASLYWDGCLPGHVFLFDMKGVGIGHLGRLSLGSIRRLCEYIQEAMPVRLRAIHVINCVWFVDRLLGLIKPFLKKELLDMLHLHTGDASEVYQYIPPECLPKDYGGELDDIATLHAEHCRRLERMRGYFLEEERLYRGYHSQTTTTNVAGDEAG